MRRRPSPQAAVAVVFTAAFHAVYLTGAGVAFLGLLFALTVRDADAASTMGPHPERGADAGLAGAE